MIGKAAAWCGVGMYRRLSPTGRGGYRLVRVARRAWGRDLWRGWFRTPMGAELELDLGTYPDCCMAFGVYELETARAIGRLLRPGDHFVDGGANLGYFTHMAALRVGPTGRVDAFEPEPHNRQRLLANLARNGPLPQVRVHAEALSNQAGTAAIHFWNDDRHNHGCASLFDDGDGRSEVTQVSTVRMDDVLAGTHPRLVKLDLEGAEPLAIEGMTQLVKAPSPPYVIAELNPDSARAAGQSVSTLIDLLLSLQPAYRVRRLVWPCRVLTDLTAAALARLGQVNLLFEPQPGG